LALYDEGSYVQDEPQRSGAEKIVVRAIKLVGVGVDTVVDAVFSAMLLCTESRITEGRTAEETTSRGRACDDGLLTGPSGQS
jgi:hypothetical protein